VAQGAVEAHVLDQLAHQRLLEAAHHRALRLGQGQLGKVLEELGRGHVVELGAHQRAGHVGVEVGRPALVHVLVRQVGIRHLLQPRQHLAREGRLEVRGLGLSQGAHGRQPRARLPVAARRDSPARLAQQAL
jgi:hypothetical protein